MQICRLVGRVFKLVFPDLGNRWARHLAGQGVSLGEFHSHWLLDLEVIGRVILVMRINWNTFLWSKSDTLVGRAICHWSKTYSLPSGSEPKQMLIELFRSSLTVMNDGYMIWDCLYETKLRLVDANPKRIRSGCGSVCIDVGIVLAVILML